MNNKPRFNAGPWRLGRSGTVVCDTPVPEMSGSEDVAYYGGHMIAESIVDRNAPLVAAAPELYDALARIVRDADSTDIALGAETHFVNMERARAALAKATGKRHD